ncbi:anti-sigma factor family protein [Methylobrevis albus]|nr:anti-sigma factor [Methylobrevis albus]
MRYDDETLTAFADGRLDPATAAEIERALETDAALAEHVAALMESGDAVKALYAPLADEPVPPALAARVADMIAAAEAREAAGAGVVAVRPRRRAPAGGFWPMAAAAAVAAIIAGPAGYLLSGPGAAPGPGSSMAALAIGAPLPTELAGLLGSVPAGEERQVGDGRLRLIASFRDAGGALCREFELDERSAVVAVACRAAAEDWQITFAVNTPIAEEGFAPASSLASLDAYLEAISAEPPMAPDEERAALAAGPAVPAP